MRLRHVPVCPYSRKIVVMLREKEIACELHAIEPWLRLDEELALNPAAEAPVLEDGERVVVDSAVIAEYLEETKAEPALIGGTLETRLEIRRLVAWFDGKFDREVTRPLWGEKMLSRFKRLGAPNSLALRAGRANLPGHLGYIGHLYSERRWLAGDDFSLADITAAAHLSVLDYLGDVPWADFPAARDWYARIKSRQSFQRLLSDRVIGLKPAPHYDDLDF